MASSLRKIGLYLVFLASIILLGRDVYAQRSSTPLPSEVIIKLKPGKSLFSTNGRLSSSTWDKIKKSTSATSARAVLGTPSVQASKYARLTPTQQRKIETLGVSRIYKLHFRSGTNTEDMQRILSQLEDVEYATLPRTYKPLAVEPNDTYIQDGSMWWGTASHARLYDAWTVTKGDTSVAVAIIDTGCKTQHPDLKNVMYYNHAELNGTDGVDDDNNGFVDDSLGYNFFDSSPEVDENGQTHGTLVSLMGMAEANNGFGFAGAGYNCRIMPLQHWCPTCNPSATYIRLYEGIIYAAENGASVINLSWGGPGSPSPYEQDIISYAAEVHDAVILAAAGNSNSEDVYYPASYNHVVSVSAYGEDYTGYYSYNYWVDLVAPGFAIARSNPTNFSDIKSIDYGTSYSAPFAAGVAALIRSQYPSLKADQVAALLRQSSNPDFYGFTPAERQDKMGRGRIDAYAAVTGKNNYQALYALNYDYVVNTSSNSDYNVGDILNLSINFINYLESTSSSATVTLTVQEGNASVIQDSYAIGELGMLDTLNNHNAPFQVQLTSGFTKGEEIILRLAYSDPTNGYTDFQFLRLELNEFFNKSVFGSPFYDVGIANNGTIQMIDEGDSTIFARFGIFPFYREHNILKQSSLILAVGADSVSDAARIDDATNSDDLYPTTTTGFEENPDESDESVILSQYNDYGSNPGNEIGIDVSQRVHSRYSNFNDLYLYLVEYELTNRSDATIDTLYAGFFADWDFPTDPTAYAAWDAANNMAYIYSDSSEYIGVKPIQADYTYYPLDLNAPTGEVDLSDSFSDQEKYKTLADVHGITTAGGAGGSDVAHVLGGRILEMEKGESRKVAFLIILGNSLSDLQAKLAYAESTGNIVEHNCKSSTPVEDDLVFCDTDNLYLVPDTPGDYYMYSDAGLTTLVQQGDTLNLSPADLGNTFYLVNRDNVLDSEPLEVTPISGTITAGIPNNAGTTTNSDFCIDALGGKMLQESAGSPTAFAYVAPPNPSDIFEVQASVTQSYNVGEKPYYTFQDNNETACFAFGMHWTFTSPTTFSANPTVRIYFRQSDIDQLEEDAQQKGNTARIMRTATQDISNFQWFWTNSTSFNPATDMSPNGPNVATTTITPSNTGTQDGVSFVEFNNISSLNGSIGGMVTMVGLLPVTLTAFEALPLPDYTVKLGWTTIQEVESAYFEVERSINAGAFTAIGRVEAQGNSNQAFEYEYIDSEPQQGITYYRLKIVDLDRSEAFSDVVVVERPFPSGTLTIAPNPADSQLEITWPSQMTNGHIQLYSISGQLVKSWKALNKPKQQLDLSNVSSGVYILHLPKEIIGKRMHRVIVR